MTTTLDAALASYTGVKEQELERYISEHDIGYDLNLLLRWLLGVADFRPGRAGLIDDFDFTQIADALGMGSWSGRRTIAQRFAALERKGVLAIIWPAGKNRRGRAWVRPYAQLVHNRSEPAAIPADVLTGEHPRSRRPNHSARPARADVDLSARPARAEPPLGARPARAEPPESVPRPGTSRSGRCVDEQLVDPSLTPESDSPTGRPTREGGRAGIVDPEAAQRGEGLVALLAERLEPRHRRDLADPRRRGDRDRLAAAMAGLADRLEPATVVDRLLADPLTDAKMPVRLLAWRAEQDLTAEPDFLDDVADVRAAALASAESLGRSLAAAGLDTGEILECISAESRFRDDPDAFGAACAAAGLGDRAAVT